MATADFCKELAEAITIVQLLPYHNMGVMKYQRLDDEASIVEAVPPADNKVEEIKSVFLEKGLNVTVH